MAKVPILYMQNKLLAITGGSDELGLAGCIGADRALSLSLFNFGAVVSDASKTTADGHKRHTLEIP